MEAVAVTGWVDDRYTALRPGLVRFATKLVRDESLAEDFVQEAFCRALGRPDLDRERVGGWLRTVVTNVATDTWRRDSRSIEARGSFEPSGCVPDHAEDVIDLEMARSAAAAAAELPQIQRQVLFAVAEGESVREIATRLGLSVRAVEGHLRRARQTVRKWAAG